jgi:hypothetical protein
MVEMGKGKGEMGMEDIAGDNSRARVSSFPISPLPSPISLFLVTPPCHP